MYPAEVVVHEVECQCVLVILNLFREPVRQPGEAPHVHPHREVVPLDIASRNVFSFRPAVNDSWDCADALRGAVAGFFSLRLISIQFDQHRVVNFSSEGEINGVQISAMAVSSQLNAVRKTGSQVIHEALGVIRRAPANTPAGNEFGIRAEGCPCPHISVAKLPALIGGHVLFLRVAERPDFIALDSLARQVAQRLVLIFRASLSNLRQQLNHSVFRNARHSHRSAYRITFNKGRDNCGLAVNREVVHA